MTGPFIRNRAYAVLFCLLAESTPSQTLPVGFSQRLFAGGLQDPDVMVFAPDGRLFVGERIAGTIRVVTPQGELLPEEFATLNVPAERHRSSGIRGLAFHPDYPTAPYLYCFYMQDSPRFNRVSRLTTDPSNPDKALAGSEEVLLEIPANATGATGSHNGGALIFGADKKLYITTGDGWEDWETWSAGDPVQSLTSFTGKVLRINDDGSIPQDNPFYDETTGDYRAIYALGFRNPYTISLHPESGELYIADVEGSAKDLVKRIVPGGNYQYEHNGSFNPDLGTPQDPWARTGAGIISGGVWYSGTAFPEEYRGSYFATGWAALNIINIPSDADNSASTFGTGIRGSDGGPVYITQGPDGNLYWLSTDYETDNGEVWVITYEDNTSVPEIAKEYSLSKWEVYSGNGIVRLHIPGGVKSSNPEFMHISILNLLGETTFSTFLAPNQSGVRFPAPPTGVYLLELRTDRTVWQRAFFIP